MEPEGVMSFAHFMEVALYCPKLGYYERPGTAPGRAGDFFTSVSVGPLFGRLLAADFSRRLQKLSASRAQIVEAGAHDGRLARDILSWFEESNSPLWPRLEYQIIEPSEERRSWQAKTLSRFANRVGWCGSPQALGERSVDGVIFSNELLDAFPVTALHWNAGLHRWTELGVTAEEERFVWTELSAPSKPLDRLLAEAGMTITPQLAAVLPDGFTLHVAAGAAEWWTGAARALGSGSLITIDYGLTAMELLHPSRAHGTLRAYYNHHVEPDVLARPGRQDLTSHVNFTQLERAGVAAGLVTQGLWSQAEFLQRIALEEWANGQPISASEVRQFQTLIHPNHLGAQFRVFVQKRDAPARPIDRVGKASDKASDKG